LRHLWYSGIDEHKAFCLTTTYGPEGGRVKQTRLASSSLALQQYFAEFAGPHQAVWSRPAGGTGWPIPSPPWGWRLVLAHATRVKAIAAAKVKTDKVDSETLALLLRADLIPRAQRASLRHDEAGDGSGLLPAARPAVRRPQRAGDATSGQGGAPTPHSLGGRG
jgi:hypothetical protein